MSSNEGEQARLERTVARLEAELSEQRAFVDELRQTRSTMHTILELTSASVFAKDLEGRYLVVNPHGAELVGLTPSQILGRTDHELYDPVSADRYRAHDMQVMAAGRAVTTQMPVPTPDGDLVYLSTMVPLVDDDGVLFGVAGIATDVTERARAEELLRRRTRELLTAQRIARIGSWSWDPASAEIEISPELSHILTGDAEGSWDLSRLVDLTHPEDREAAIVALNGMRAGIEADLVFRLLDTDEHGAERVRWVRLRSEPDEETSELVVGTVQDVTDRELAERERLDLEHRLGRAQRLESVGQLAGGVAHDFNNLLAVIGMEADLALGELAPDHPGGPHLVQLQHAVQRAAALTRQLLVFSRHERYDRRPLDLRELVVGLAILLRRSLGEDIELVLDLDQGMGAVVADRSQMEQVLVNLAVNARDAMPSGGTLSITGRNDGDDVVLRVVDTGTGMTSEVAERAFEPFFTTKPRGAGTGLGLATVHTIVTSSEGRVDLHPGPVGTTVEIRLPATDRAADRPADAATRAGRSDAGRGTVLVVEDQAALGKLAATILRRAGYRALLAGHAGEALELAAAEPSIDLLLTDVVMPKVSGGELAERLRAERPDLPVIFMSGYSAGMVEGRLPAGEQVQMLSKPFSAAELLVAVRRVLGVAAPSAPDDVATGG